MLGKRIFLLILDFCTRFIHFSFHCGSGQMTSKAFVDAIQNARMIMNYGLKLGFNMTLLDLGGGFPGNSGTEEYFSQISAAVNEAIDEHFPDNGKIRIIAEPGRYYVASAYTLATSVIACREMIEEGLLNRLILRRYLFIVIFCLETGKKKFMYYINDGVYGSFNCVLYDHYVPTPTLSGKVRKTNEFSDFVDD